MYTPVNEVFSLFDALMVSIISIVIVFAVLIFIIVVASVFSSVIVNVNKRKYINPRVENKILEDDEDAIAAVVVASIDYYNETKKHAKLVSITKVEEE